VAETRVAERHPLEAFGDLTPLGAASDRANCTADYYYQGQCPRTGQHHQLPRTELAKAIARGLMAQLAPAPEGKMYGVLLVQDQHGQPWVLKAFSGLWRGQRQVPGWVPPIPGRDRVALQEAETLHQLQEIKERLLTLQHLPERQTLAQLVEEIAQQRQALREQHQRRKQHRAQQRQILQATVSGDALRQALEDLDQQSRRAKAELRALKQRHSEALAPLQQQIEAANQEISALKRQRQAISQRLQAQLHQAYTLTNFAGEAWAIQDLATQGNLPTGTGNCCAPKLLHAAAHQGLRPLALAEFWWGPAQGDKQPGQFYGACAERCQPIMGFLLSGLSAVSPPSPVSLDVPRLYEDDQLVVINKPAGLLSVPGRYGDRQDSVLTRLQLTDPDAWLKPVHRLDQDTSGVLVLARTATAHRHLSRQFQHRQVRKTYEALLEGVPPAPQGLIDLPLWGDPDHRPRQVVDWQRGKPSQTQYQVVVTQGNTSRVMLQPLTGRTHQLRLHAAHPQGLNAPIRGDRLYGSPTPGQRLCLHARQLGFTHPQNQTWLEFQAPVPF
jgi:tRNA pseudouridine32 synthase/23S rRNA pseudouridine746 synthase